MSNIIFAQFVEHFKNHVLQGIASITSALRKSLCPSLDRMTYQTMRSAIFYLGVAVAG